MHGEVGLSSIRNVFDFNKESLSTTSLLITSVAAENAIGYLAIAIDDAGNDSSANVEIIVPHDKGKKK